MMLVSWNAMPRSRAYCRVSRVRVAENLGGHEADDARDAMAIALEIGEIEVAVALEVHRHAVDHRLEVLLRQPIRGHDGSQRERHRMLRRAGEDGADLAAATRRASCGRARDR